MSQWPNLAVAIGVSLTVSTCIVLVLARPLRSLLEQMCPSGDGARWWFSFTAVMLYVTPLMFAIWATGTIAAADPVAIVRGALGASLFGTFAALLVIGQQIPRDRERDRGRF
jgi:hypothetical protein